MAERPDRNMVVLLHVPKTGGTSLNWWLREHLDLQAFSGPKQRLEPARLKKWSNQCGKEAHWRPDVVIGHNVPYMPGLAGVQWGIVLRHPADWLLSCYHNDAMRRPKKIGTFEEWYEHPGPNTVLPMAAKRHKLNHYLVRWFGAVPIHRKRDVLTNFWGVWTTEHLSDAMSQLSDYFQIPVEERHDRQAGMYDPVWDKTIPRHYALSDAIRARIEQENPRDMLLWQWALACGMV